MNQLNRRDFLKTTGLVGAALLAEGNWRWRKRKPLPGPTKFTGSTWAAGWSWKNGSSPACLPAKPLRMNTRFVRRSAKKKPPRC